VLDGEQHLRMRRLLLPSFHGDAVRTYRSDQRAHCCRGRTLAGWGSYILPAGTTVAASILGVQRSEAYENPEEFRPERFLDRTPPPYTLIPFGGGVRRCVGASFAVMEIKTILRTTLERVRLRPTNQKPERPVRWRRFTVTPARGGRVTISAPTSVNQPATH
jgi:cytochrome P450